MRIIETHLIANTIYEIIKKASFSLPPHVLACFDNLKKNETSDMAVEVLQVLQKNAEIAQNEQLPLCQDCGFTTIFMEIGQDVSLTGGSLYEVINSAVATAYHDFKLRKSIVADPLNRNNTGTNTPAFVHADIVDGDQVKLTVYLKGGGSENMSLLRMFRPTDSTETIIKFIEEAVIEAGPNPCPPIFLGIGIGGTADIAVLNSKKAVLRDPGTMHHDPFYQKLEKELIERLNGTNVGPLGFGGKGTVCGVYIKEAATHIASLPVAINMSCHSFRTGTVII